MSLIKTLFLIFVIISICSCGKYGKLYNEAIILEEKQIEQLNTNISNKD